jgi:uncharacterized membrane protein YhaH (DUF805 family)
MLNASEAVPEDTFLGHFSISGLFGIHGRMRPRAYLLVGIVLALFKYAVEFTVITLSTGEAYSPLEFLSPFLSSKEKFLTSLPAWFGWMWLLWTLPFLWISVNLSVRRAFDAGLSPWFGLVLLIPFVNFVGIVVLALLPSKKQLSSSVGQTNIEVMESVVAEVAEVYRAPSTAPLPIDNRGSSSSFLSGVFGLLAGAAYLIVSVLASVYLLGSYGAVMFFGVPIVTCAVSAYALNRIENRGLGFTILHSFLTLMAASVGLLVFGIEGGICIAMAIPIIMPVGFLGTLVGYSIAITCRRPGYDERRGLYGCMALLPLLGYIEIAIDESPVFEAKSEILVNAPVELVWSRVVDFPEIAKPPVGILNTGIAYPVRAQIDGVGVGAIRTCEFNTGKFVEPITCWEPPVRLSFDVTSQPEPMSELSPYRHLHPPHLDGSFRSLRGEFRLRRISDRQTLLEGSTWYRVDIGPRLYWRQWTDLILHRIHERVLEHVREIAESEFSENQQRLQLP